MQLKNQTNDLKNDKNVMTNQHETGNTANSEGEWKNNGEKEKTPQGRH